MICLLTELKVLQKSFAVIGDGEKRLVCEYWTFVL